MTYTPLQARVFHVLGWACAVAGGVCFTFDPDGVGALGKLSLLLLCDTLVFFALNAWAISSLPDGEDDDDGP